jgi:hypothetical protein
MRKFLFSLLLLIITLVSGAQYRIIGYYPNSVYGDYTIVYGYYDANGVFTLSHCRTNGVMEDIYSNRVYLDINTCTLRKVEEEVPAPSAQTGAPQPPPPPVGEKAFR